MTYLFITLTLMNMAIGFGLAVYLGIGPPGLREAWYAATHEPVYIDPAQVIELEPAPRPADLEQMFDVELDYEAEFQPLEQSYDGDFDAVAALLSPDNPELWDLNEKYVETSILKLNVAMLRSGARATEIDTRLRLCRGQTDIETVRECLALLREDCESYLAEQSEAAEKLEGRIGELGELRSLGEEIQMANMDQAAQIETSLSNLQHMDFSSDLEAANQRLLSEIHNLRMARHRLRDSQEAAFLVVARYENRLDAIAPQLFMDPLTRLRNRIGLETTLARWWKENRHQSRQISAGVFDLDAFGKINEDHGSLVADKILYQLSQWLHSAIGKNDLLARLAGQRFIWLVVDSGPRNALKSLEQARQTIEQITFFDGGTEISLTACLGATEVQPTDEFGAVIHRCEAALKVAKQAGPNHAAQHVGGTAQLVETPNFGAKAAEIVL
ncbi:MAG: diguanylate cyclase domain-containing protein [Planctomycetota bacterium]